MRKLVMPAIVIAVLFLVSCGGSEPTPSQTPVPNTAMAGFEGRLSSEGIDVLLRSG